MAEQIDQHTEVFGCIPHQIDAEWDPRFAYLAGFPLNLMYMGARDVDGRPELASCCYWFDPGTYTENEGRREMWYFAEHESPYRLCVSCDANGSNWETVKYRGDAVVCIAHGTEFDKAMLHATMVALRPDEPVDSPGE